MSQSFRGITFRYYDIDKKNYCDLEIQLYDHPNYYICKLKLNYYNNYILNSNITDKELFNHKLNPFNLYDLKTVIS